MATISRRKIYDIPEEVGMDIVEAIDMLEIITLKGKSSAFSDKIYFEIMKIFFFLLQWFFFHRQENIKNKTTKNPEKKFSRKKIAGKIQGTKISDTEIEWRIPARIAKWD